MTNDVDQAKYDLLRRKIIEIYKAAAQNGHSYEAIAAELKAHCWQRYAGLSEKHQNMLDGVRDAMIELHNQDVLVMTFVVDGRRYDRNATLDVDGLTKSMWIQCYKLNGKFIPFTQEHRRRDNEFGIISMID